MRRSRLGVSVACYRFPTTPQTPDYQKLPIPASRFRLFFSSSHGPRPPRHLTPDTRHLYEFESKKGLRLDAYCQRDESEKSWEELVQHLLNKGGYTDDDLINSRKSAAWKLELAATIKTRSGVTNAWLAQRLNLGNPTRASHQIKQWQAKT